MNVSIWFSMVKLQHVLKKDRDDADDDDDNDGDEDSDDAIIAEGLMNCLIQYKHHPMMDEKCRSGIEHHQLVSERYWFFEWAYVSFCQSVLHV